MVIHVLQESAYVLMLSSMLKIPAFKKRLNDEKKQFCEKLGAHKAINYNKKDFYEEIKKKSEICTQNENVWFSTFFRFFPRFFVLDLDSAPSLSRQRVLDTEKYSL